jgi:hypothetical protein
MKPNFVLIVGSQHSGTSWLCGLLGAHSKINMLDEAFTRDALKGYGKTWVGNKLCLYNQIRYEQRGGLWALLWNKLYYTRVIPRSVLSIRDYMRLGAKIIILKRDTYSLVESMVSRSGFSERKAMREIRKGDEIVERIMRSYEDWMIVQYEHLKQHPMSNLIILCQFLGLEFEEGMIEQGTECNFRYGEHGKEYVNFRTKAV